jgi:hypothetical protein
VLSQPHASVTCRAIHSAVGCAVTPSHRMRRRSCRKTYLEGMFSSPATAGAFVEPCTWRPRFARRRCRA